MNDILKNDEMPAVNQSVDEASQNDIPDINQDAKKKNDTSALIPYDDQYATLLNVAKFEQLQRAAKVFASSTMVPPHYQSNIANCFIALQISTRLGIDPFMFMQNSYIVSGKVGLEAKLIMGMLNTSGLISGRPKYILEGDGENLTCTCEVVDARSGEIISETLKFSDAIKIGKAASNPNWKAIPKLMIRYRTITYLIRTYYSELLIGLYTKDELDDVHGTIDVTPRHAAHGASTTNKLEEMLVTKKQQNQD